jgi:hypothetical protein
VEVRQLACPQKSALVLLSVFPQDTMRNQPPSSVGVVLSVSARLLCALGLLVIFGLTLRQ